MAKLLLLNGPNLNLLGRREPQHYGATRLTDIEQQLQKNAKNAGHELHCFQSNAEHQLVERIQASMDEDIEFIIINPAAFTHTSVAIRDALNATDTPFIEIHLSNIYARESFRHKSYFSDLAVGVISGLGANGYHLALQAAINHISQHQTTTV